MNTFSLRTSLLLPGLLSIFAALVVPVQGQVLVQWGFDGGTVGGPLSAIAAPTTTAANVNGSNATQTGVTFTGNATTSNADRISVTLDGLGGSTSSGVYLEFTVTPNPGYFINISSISFNLQTTSGVAGTAPRTSFAQVVDNVTGNFTSLTGVRDLGVGTPFTTNVTSSNIDVLSSNTARVALTNYSVGAIGNADFTATLGGPSYSNITSAYTFRLYPWDNSTVTNARLGIDNVTINGTAAVIPEPSTWALLGLGLLAVVIFRKRHRMA